jgi:guanylate kinase
MKTFVEQLSEKIIKDILIDKFGSEENIVEGIFDNNFNPVFIRDYSLNIDTINSIIQSNLNSIGLNEKYLIEYLATEGHLKESQKLCSSFLKDFDLKFDKIYIDTPNGKISVHLSIKNIITRLFSIHNYYQDNQIILGKEEKLDYNFLLDLIKVGNKLVLMGKGGSGKDYCVKKLQELFPEEIKKEVSFTTRPMRNGEIDGIDYHFISEDYASKLIANGEIIQYTRHANGYLYGTIATEFEKCNLCILTPNAIHKFPKKYLNQFYIIYFDIDKETRRARLSKRSDSHDCERRLQSDEIDFEGFKAWNLKITNPNY